MHLEHIQNANQHHCQLCSQQSPALVAASRCLHLVCEQHDLPHLAHAFTVIHVLHKWPIAVTTQLLKCAAPCENTLVSRIALNAQRTPCDVGSNAFVDWAWIVETHAKGPTYSLIIPHDF